MCVHEYDSSGQLGFLISCLLQISVRRGARASYRAVVCSRAKNSHPPPRYVPHSALLCWPLRYAFPGAAGYYEEVRIRGGRGAWGGSSGDCARSHPSPGVLKYIIFDPHVETAAAPPTKRNTRWSIEPSIGANGVWGWFVFRCCFFRSL